MILEGLAIVSGVFMAAANFPQAIRIFRRKSAVDLSFTTWMTWTVGTIIWLIYGIKIKNLPIIITNAVGTVSCLMVMIGWVMYRKGAPVENPNSSKTEAIILNLIRQNGQARRKDLLPVTGLSRSSLGRVLDEMEKKGLIKQQGERKTSFYILKMAERGQNL